MSVKTLYNPATLSKDELVANFVVRTKVFDKIFKDIKSSTMKYPEKHYLIQGQRGMGKTTLLLRLKYEIENTPALNSWLIPVFFGEENYDLTSLSRLWEKLLEYLDDEWDTGGIHYEHTEAFVDFDDYEKRCFEYLIETLRANERKIILFFDNFGQLFLDNLKEKEKRRLREVLMHCKDIRIIGASAIVLQDLHNYSEPFYEFFDIIHLNGLSKEETFQLIERLQEHCENKIDLKKSKAKIETLSVLTGGVIRTLMMVYQLLLDDQDGSALNDLEIVLDQVTPLYKHRIEDLPVQQRRIVDVIARRWDAVSAKDIAGQIREDGKSMSTKLISAHLQQLEKNNVIEKKQTDTKNNLYQLKERFFNIWYLMRNGDRRDKMRVIWLTKFLELWYEDEEALDVFLQRHLKQLRSGKYHAKSALLIAEALFNSDKLNLERQNLLYKETAAILNSKEKKLLDSPRKRKMLKAYAYYKKGQFIEAAKVLEEIKNKNVDEIALYAWSLVGKQDYEGAINTISQINPSEKEDVINIAILYFVAGAPEKTFRLLNEKSIKDEPKVALLKGDAYLKLGNIKLSEKYYRLAAKGDSDYKVFALEHLSSILIETKRYEEAEKALLSALKLTPQITLYKKLLDLYLFVKERDEASYKKSAAILELNTIQPEKSKDADLLLYQGIVELYETSANKYSTEAFKRVSNIFEKACAAYIKGGLENYNPSNLLVAFYVCMMFYKDFLRDKGKAIHLFNSGEALFDTLLWKLYGLFISVWTGEYENIEKELIDIQRDDLFKDNGREHLVFNEILLLLMSRKQYHIALNVFNNFKNLEGLFKPTYYALMTFLKDEYPNEIIKMGNELKEPVDDILKTISEMENDYK
ncbi:winged-helix domain-containing protein [Parapedobacter koreensis]|uniref:Tetratricopeptide repeat-containing protein n=1 Tax=Parapedobacter koreensis TaxID=332977 RepID=A0A1H7F0S0_9SPHI|nr:winged-helix domain-containing protein [Parapedobacter koreensis]SEK17590.1 Tetratricopeptide repeat-containing protein [Parapedobacter koreensis]